MHMGAPYAACLVRVLTRAFRRLDDSGDGNSSADGMALA